MAPNKKTTNRIHHTVENTPFVGVGLLGAIIALAILDLFFTIGWFLNVLEIQSVFNQLLPEWPATAYMVVMIVTDFFIWLLLKAFPAYKQERIGS